MCLTFLAIDQCADAPLILLFNRDEDYGRETERANLWDIPGGWIYGGRDLLKGGTWAGVNHRGQFGMLTFVREPRRVESPRAFRGEIVPEFLRMAMRPEDFLNTLSRRAGDYLHFNLLVGGMNGVFHYSNKTDPITPLKRGLHGVSNALLNTPWFKVRRGKKRLKDVLKTSPLDYEAYFQIMLDQTEAPAREVQDTGLDFDYERLRSPLFVRASDYGTRSSTVVVFYRNGSVDYIERTYAYDPQHFQTTLQSFPCSEFTLGTKRD